jgi:hypothetical protein
MNENNSITNLVIYKDNITNEDLSVDENIILNEEILSIDKTEDPDLTSTTNKTTTINKTILAITKDKTVSSSPSYTPKTNSINIPPLNFSDEYSDSSLNNSDKEQKNQIKNIIKNKSNEISVISDISVVEPIYDRIIDRQIYAKILDICESYSNCDNNLTSLVELIITHVKTLLSKHTNVSSSSILKYKDLLKPLLDEICEDVKSITISKKNKIDVNLMKAYEEAQILSKSIELKNDNTFAFLIYEITSLIIMIKNTIICMVLWRGGSKYKQILEDYIYRYEHILTIIVTPLSRELNNNAEERNAQCEPRLLTKTSSMENNNGRVNSPHLKRHLQHGDFYNVQKSNAQSNDTATATTTEYTNSLYNERNSNNVNNITGDKKLITFNELSIIINESYGNNPDMECSTALDIVALFLRSQKILYIESKNYCEQYLNMLMIPAICISAVVGLLALILTSANGYIVVACLSTINTLLLTLISYLKFDAKAEAHKTSAYHFDKLETKCSFLSGQILFFESVDTDTISNIVKDVEIKIKEIKEINQFVIPEYVRTKFPKTYASGIFSEVKKLYIEEIVIKNELKNTINKIIIKSRKINKSDEEIAEIKELEEKQDRQLNRIILFKKKYLELDKILKYEVEKNMRLKRMKIIGLCGCMNTITCGCWNYCVMCGGPKKPVEHTSSDSGIETDGRVLDII